LKTAHGQLHCLREGEAACRPVEGTLPWRRVRSGSSRRCRRRRASSEHPTSIALAHTRRRSPGGARLGATSSVLASAGPPQRRARGLPHVAPVDVSNDSCNRDGDTRVVVPPITSNVDSLYPGEAMIDVKGRPGRAPGGSDSIDRQAPVCRPGSAR
jgi:hypothetical protein